MRNILTISKREITRLRTRFTGKSRLILLVIVALTVTSSLVIYHQDLVISKGLYTVGASADAPSIADKRFNIVELERDVGYRLLDQGKIDLYIDGNDVVNMGDKRSEYAAGVLQQYLEKQELVRISNEYEIDSAFPLRVEIRYLDSPEGGSTTESDASPLEIPEPTKPAALSPEISVPSSPPKQLRSVWIQRLSKSELWIRISSVVCLDTSTCCSSLPIRSSRLSTWGRWSGLWVWRIWVTVRD